MSDPRPPKSPRKGKYVNIRIAFLNDTVHVFQVPVKGVGSLLWDAVVNHLHLLEADYFDLEYTNHQGDDCWLDKDKNVLKQIGSADIPLRFCVKFYTPDPGLLEDELTRYLFALQVRKDLLRGELRCSENTAALLASYIVQGEIGDFDVEEYPDPTYLAVFKFVPEHLQTHEFMAKVMDYHKQHIGESPSEADLNLLDTARKVELYGIKMQPAKDHEGVALNLAVAHLGVLVFQQFTKINTFSWAKVRKLSFKRKKFLIKLHADTYDRRLEGVAHTPTKSGRGYYKDTVEFFFDTRDRCKLFWKRCIEHHAFFRCQVVAKLPRNKTRVVSRGSSFRYCGRTQKQLVEFVRENIGKRPHFERSTSGRISSRSASVTPKISSKPGMHSSSADLHTSSGSRSSGSHILDSNHTPGSGVTRDHSGTPHSAMRVESVDVHSDSSMSGSRSLNSPRLEHGLSIDQDVIEAVNARTEGAMTDDEEDDAEMKDNRDNQGREKMSHVASETKGAHSVYSPELSSPVRYVGLYSEVGSPVYQGDGDGVTSPDLDNTDPGFDRAPRVVSPAAGIDSKQVVVDHPPSSGGGDDQALAPDSHGASGLETDSSDISVSPGGSSVPVSDLNNQVSRPNLDLKLTNVTSSSSTSSSITSSVGHDQPRPRAPPLSHLHHTKSPSSPRSPPTHTSKPITSTPSQDTPIPSQDTIKVSSTSTSPTPLTLSASQNANDLVSQTTPEAMKPKAGDSISNTSSLSKKHQNVPADVNVKRVENTHEPKKVSSVDVGQQLQHRQQAKVKDTDNTPPYPSPPPPLSPQYSEEDVKRSLDASPSSCVTDTAQSRQDQKVRLSSRVSSLDSNRSSPVSDLKEKSISSMSPKSSVQENETVVIGKEDAEKTSVEKHEVKKPVDEKANLEKSGAEGSSPTKQIKSDKVDLKKIYPNGGLVGAGKPEKEQLTTESGSSRKLSAGTDLIDDIPYILHRRLDGQKEETAVYKVSEADKIKRQRSTSPATKGIALSCLPHKKQTSMDDTYEGRSKSLERRSFGEERSKSLDRRSFSPESVVDSKLESMSASGSMSSGSGRSRPTSDKSPPLNRRFEFVNVHKLPARTSYSSVDDTTSPSGEQGILKQLEHSASAKTDEASAPTEGKKDGKSVSLAQSKDQKKPEAASVPTAGKIEDSDKSVAGVIGEGPKSDQEPAKEVTSSISPSEKSLKSQDSQSVVQDMSTQETPTDSKDVALKQSGSSEASLCSDGVQFYSPKIPGTQRFKKFINTSTSDESPDSSAAVAEAQTFVSPSSVSSDNVSDMVLEEKKQKDNQYFEVSKPQPCHGGDSSDNVYGPAPESAKAVPKSLPLKTSQSKPGDLPLNTFGKPQSPAFQSGDEDKDNQESKGKSPQQRAPSLSVAGRTSTSSTSSSSETNQFLIDLPSPAAALFYSDNESPPPSQSDKDDSTKSSLTFSTFRPDPAEEAMMKGEEASREKLKGNRWSLQSVEEDEESSDFKVIMSEGVVEKSALKKRTSDETDRPREPKRVSWHEDGELQHSYHSDLSMTAQRSPVDEHDTSALFGEGTTTVDSGDILETLENLRRQNSESDMTNSGSSVSSSDNGGSDIETESNATQVYLRYAASKGLNPSSKDGTIDSGVGGMSEGGRSQGHEPSPLESLERLGSMEDSGSSFGGRKFSLKDETHKSHQDRSPLEPLEKLRGLRVDNFDDEGEADDEDDEPNFPPPPPILDIPEEMLVSYESDLPLPDISYPSSDPLESLQGATSSRTSIMTYSSDSDNGSKTAASHSSKSNRISLDPLASLEFGDLVGEMHCTTSESESDFDADEANLQLRRMSASNISKDVAGLALGDPKPRPHSEPKRAHTSGRSMAPTVPRVSEKPVVLPKPSLQHRPQVQSAQGQQSGSTHVVQKSQPLPHRSGPPPPVHPKPQPPPVHPRPGPGPIRQPQMGKGKHFDRTRHKSSSSSSSSSSEPRQSTPPSHHHS